MRSNQNQQLFEKVLIESSDAGGVIFWPTNGPIIKLIWDHIWAATLGEDHALQR